METFSALPKYDINTTTPSHQRHAVFQFFIKQGTAHRNRLISLLKEGKVLKTSLITIWENTEGCAEQYICASALYLMSVMSQCYSVVID